LQAVRKADYDRAIEELKAQIEEEDMMIEEAEVSASAIALLGKDYIC
jgi:hypothetical protein